MGLGKQWWCNLGGEWTVFTTSEHSVSYHTYNNFTVIFYCFRDAMHWRMEMLVSSTYLRKCEMLLKLWVSQC